MHSTRPKRFCSASTARSANGIVGNFLFTSLNSALQEVGNGISNMLDQNMLTQVFVNVHRTHANGIIGTCLFISLNSALQAATSHAQCTAHDMQSLL